MLKELPMSFPRVCGDVSEPQFLFDSYIRLSPRMRGCFHVVLM